MDDRFLGRQVE